MKKIDSDYLINFEKEIASNFNNKKIRAPIHLYGGNEKQIIKIFEKIKRNDWVFCSWRSHYQCLLKGVPSKLLKQKILKGNSISLNFSKYKIFSSAIVGGQIPISVGVAKSLQRNKSNDKVYCFLGDMTSETGIFHECLKYSKNFNLPIHFIIEDNSLSVCTDTKKTWALKNLSHSNKRDPYISYYKYKLTYPHSGAGKRIEF